MSINPIPFQPGLSRLKFQKLSGTDRQYETTLAQARWPQGFVCFSCAHSGHSVFKAGLHKTFQSRTCRHQFSLNAGTFFQPNMQQLKVWSLAIDLISKAKTGLTALALKQYPGVSHHNARLIQHKLKQALSKRGMAPTTRQPLTSCLARTTGSGQLKKNIRSNDGDC